MSEMRLRDITADDLPVAQKLLSEGFPRRSGAYWAAAFETLAARAEVPGYPRFGLLLEVEGTAQGIILLISSQQGETVRSNLSSWYVREAHRKYATFMFQRTLKAKGGVYLNLSPSPVALPIATAFGFKPYTGGTLVIDPRAALRGGAGAQMRRLRSGDLSSLEGAQAETIKTHLAYGCDGLLLSDAGGPMIALYRRERFKRIVPAVRFVCGDPVRLAAASGPLARHLLGRGLAVALLDRPQDLVATGPGQTVMAARGIRYAKGAQPPAVGDLLETEVPLLGA